MATLAEGDNPSAAYPGFDLNSAVGQLLAYGQDTILQHLNPSSQQAVTTEQTKVTSEAKAAAAATPFYKDPIIIGLGLAAIVAIVVLKG